MHGLSVRARGILRNIVSNGVHFGFGRKDVRFRGIVDVRQFQGIGMEDLLLQKNCGRATAREIANWLAKHGVSVKQL